jgi:hypothetical protein
MDKSLAKVLDKIKKCLALSESANPHEAQAALRQARKLMELNGLSQSDVEASKATEQIIGVSSATRRHAARWVCSLAYLIASSFSCRAICSTGPDGQRIIFIGLGSDPELAGYAFSVMRRQLVQARKSFVRSLPAKVEAPAKRRQADYFVNGWLAAVYRLIEEFAGLDEEASSAINAFTQQMYPDLEDAPPTRKRRARLCTQAEMDSYKLGLRIGSDSRIHRPVAGGHSQALLGTPPTASPAQGALF